MNQINLLGSITLSGFPFYFVVFLLGAVASGINTVAGGGSLISFPVLTTMGGLASKVANSTNSVGLWPGSLTGALAFIHAIKKTWPKLKPLIVPTIIGSQIGAVLLLVTPSHVFDIIVPFLILFAVGLLAFQKQLKAWTAASGRHVSLSTGIVLQTLVSIYGGYFGAGMGIMMLAVLSLYVEGTIHDHNAIKNWLGMLINFSITFTFFFNHLVVMSIALPMIAGSLLGGYFAGTYSQKVNPDVLRKWIIGYGLISAGYFIYQAIK